MKIFLGALATFICSSIFFQVKAEIIDRYSRDCGFSFQQLVNKENHGFEWLHVKDIRVPSEALMLSRSEHHAYDLFIRHHLERYYPYSIGTHLKVGLAKYYSRPDQSLRGLRIDLITTHHHRLKFYYELQSGFPKLLVIMMDKPVHKKLWVCEGFYHEIKSDDQLLREMARDIGGPFHPHGSRHEDQLRMVSPEVIPVSIMAVAHNFVHRNTRPQTSPDLSIDNIQYLATRKGKIAGYVLALSPITDGGVVSDRGILIYVNSEGVIVEEQEWWL